MKDICFLINPSSGGNKGAKFTAKLRNFLTNQSKENIDITDLDFNKIDNQLLEAKKYSTIVIGGGDGTISSLIYKLQNHPRIGIIPFGTGNDLARELGISRLIKSKSLAEIIEFYKSSNTRSINIGKLEYGENFALKTHFVNYVSFGFDAKVVADFANLRKTRRWQNFRGVFANRMLYVFACMKNFSSTLKPCTITNSKTTQKINLEESRSLIFTNIQSFMGMAYSTKKFPPADDKIEVINVKNIWGYLSMFIDHSIQFLEPNFLGRSQSWNLNTNDPNCNIQIDGEPFLQHNSIQFKISVEGSANLVVGENFN